MRKRAGAILIIAYIITILVITYSNIQMGRIIELSAVFLIISFIVLFESKNIDAKTMAAVATLSAIGGVMRVPFAAIPAFQPVTFIAAVSGYTLGPVNGFMVGAMCAFISNFFLGHGPWTLWQMMGWGLCGVFFGLNKRWIKKTGRWGFVCICGLWGYIYGAILDQWYVVAYFRPITWKVVITGIALSFGYDSMHAFGNVVFSSIFGKNFINVLERYNRKNSIEYLDSDNYSHE